MLSRLTGDTWEKTEMLDPKSLLRPDGASILIQYLRDKYEPIEHRKIGKIMDEFMYSFDRHRDEEIMDFDTRFDKEIAKAEQAAGTISETWKAHLYLKKMRLPSEKESLVLTGALGKYTVHDLRKSALSAFPRVDFRRGKDGPVKTWVSQDRKKQRGQGHNKGRGGDGVQEERFLPEKESPSKRDPRRE